ncbi:hypothetical protein LCGC14_2653690 [marine sediment metagenome]|uniref:Right handed beta helix domain-containing protein n=1 Tax=marine sediment metagenome TaxID=412755 RepID=A0A0F9AGD1_9ZZZZ
MAAIRGKYLRMLVEAFQNTRGVTDKACGTVYYCDGNFGADTNDGLSWDTPFKTLAVAFAASHADIGRGSDRWARRNTIYIAGDSFEENLVILPQKTDVIGVGSYNGQPGGANILGNHVPVNAGMGCRFYNVGFESVTAGIIMTLTGACWGVQFHNCEFRAIGTLTATQAIKATACASMIVKDCNFLGGFTGDVIEIGAGQIAGMKLIGNTITGGANDGIRIIGVATISTGRRGTIADNFIQVAAITLDTRTVSVFNVYNNQLISANNTGGTAFVIDLTFASGNYFTGGNNSAEMIPKAADA